MDQSQLSPERGAKKTSRFRDSKALVFGAVSLSLIASILYPPVPGEPWAEQLVLVLVGALLWITPGVLILTLFHSTGIVTAIFGPVDSSLRSFRCFWTGFLAVTPPIWAAIFTGLDLFQSLPPAIALLVPLFFVPVIARLPLIQAGSLPMASVFGWLGVLVGVSALWLGPIGNWRTYGELSAASLSPRKAELTIGASSVHPDVLLISVDTLRADAVYGDQSANTPFLDSLRQGGTSAAYALSSSNRTVPGHAGMLTGQGALWHGITANRQRLPEALPTVAEAFRAEGYRTFGLIGNGLMRVGTGFERGFQDFDDQLVAEFSHFQAFLDEAYGRSLLGLLIPRDLFKRVGRIGLFGYRGQRTVVEPEDSMGGQATERALDLLGQAYGQDQSFFFFLHYMDPHAPYYSPIGYYQRREGDSDHQRYLEEVEFIDDCIKRVVERMEESGRPFVLCFTSDHGEHFGEHGLVDHGNSLYNELLKVPFLLYGDGIPAGLVLEEVSLQDISPTLLQRCNIEPLGMRGRNLLEPESAREERQGFFHFARDEHFSGAIIGDYKWISPKDWTPSDGAEGSVYLWHDDPLEQNALDIMDLPERDWLSIVRAMENAEPPEHSTYTQKEALRQAAILRELGYLDELEPEDGSGVR